MRPHSCVFPSRCLSAPVRFGSRANPTRPRRAGFPGRLLLPPAVFSGSRRGRVRVALRDGCSHCCLACLLVGIALRTFLRTEPVLLLF